MSRLRVALLTFSALVVASLIAALVLLAQENLDARPVLVVGAPKPAPVRPVALPEPAPAFMQLQLPRAAIAHVPAAPLAPRTQPGGAHRRDDVAFPLATAARLARTPHLPPKPEAAVAAPDPDVVLITAILLLTPPNAPASSDPALGVCSANPASDGGCTALHGMKP